MRRSLVLNVALGLLAAGFLVVLFLLLEAASTHAFAPDSDGASVVLEGHTMATGNFLLAHWNMSTDSFWTIDALFYAVATSVIGVSQAMPHIGPALIGTAVIAVGVLVAVDERRGFPAVVAAGTVIAILGLPTEALAYFFLRGPLHVGTALFGLVSFYALKKGRFGVGWVVAVLFLAAGFLGDLQIVLLGTVPIMLTGLTSALRTRRWREAVPMVTAGFASVVLAEIVRQIVKLLGGFKEGNANPIASLSEMARNLKHGLHEAIVLFGGSGSYFGIAAEPKPLEYLHLVTVALVAVAIIVAVVGLLVGVVRGRTDAFLSDSADEFRLDDMCLFGVLGSATAFVILALAPDPQYSRYLTAGVIFSTVLAARVLGRLADEVGLGLLGAAGAVLGLAVAGCYAAVVALDIGQPAPPSGAAAIGSFLEAHHLTDGMGAYWSASVVTVESRGKVQVRPVVSGDGRSLVRYDHLSSALWYLKPFHFLVYEPGAPWGGVDATTATTTFGPASRTYLEDGYEVLVWDKGVILPRRPHGR